MLADRIAIIRRGQIIAHGTPLELKQHLLGAPMMEIRLAEPLNGLVGYLESKVDVVDHGQDWVRYTVSDPGNFNPALLMTLAQQETPVITLSEVSRSLEEVYLRIVESDQQVETIEQVSPQEEI